MKNLGMVVCCSVLIGFAPSLSAASFSVNGPTRFARTQTTPVQKFAEQASQLDGAATAAGCKMMSQFLQELRIERQTTSYAPEVDREISEINEALNYMGCNLS